MKPGGNHCVARGMLNLRALIVAVLLTLWCAPSTFGQACGQRWEVPAGQFGVGGNIAAMTAWDPDGAGPGPDVLLLVGGFSWIDSIPAPGVAAWDGTAFQPVGTRRPGGTVKAAVAAGGTAYIVTTTEVLRWNGADFAAVGAGPDVFTQFCGFGDRLLGFAPSRQVFAYEPASESWEPFGPELPSECRAITSNGPRLVAAASGSNFVFEYVSGSWVTRDPAGCSFRDIHAAPFGATGDGVVRMWGGFIGAGQHRYSICGAYSSEGFGGDGRPIALPNHVIFPVQTRVCESGTFDLAGENILIFGPGLPASGTTVTGGRVACAAVFRGEVYVGGSFSFNFDPFSKIAVYRNSSWQPLRSVEAGRCEAVGRLADGRIAAAWAHFPNPAYACYEPIIYAGDLRGLQPISPRSSLFLSASTRSDWDLFSLNGRNAAFGLAFEGLGVQTSQGWQNLNAFSQHEVVQHNGALLVGNQAWDGQNLTPFPAGLTGSPRLSVDGVLYGETSTHWSYLQGSTWIPIASNPQLRSSPRFGWFEGAPVVMNRTGQFQRLVGTTWVPMGSVIGTSNSDVRRFVIWRNTLYAGGSSLPCVEGTSTLVRWENGDWHNVEGSPTGLVTDLQPTEEGLWVAGSFGEVSGIRCIGLAMLRLPCESDINCDGLVNASDVGQFMGEWDAAAPTADFNRDGAIDGEDVIAYFGHWDSGC